MLTVIDESRPLLFRDLNCGDIFRFKDSSDFSKIIFIRGDDFDNDYLISLDGGATFKASEFLNELSESHPLKKFMYLDEIPVERLDCELIIKRVH